MRARGAVPAGLGPYFRISGRGLDGNGPALAVPAPGSASSGTMLRLAVSLGALLALLASSWLAPAEGAAEGSRAPEGDGELQPKPFAVRLSLSACTRVGLVRLTATIEC